MTLSFVSSGPSPRNEPWGLRFSMRADASKFTNTIGLRLNGEVLYQAAEFDPWLEQDKTFIRAVQTADASLLAQ